MKVVLFCGGLGTRLRDYTDTVPKPMVNIGYRPLLWQVMKYYAHFGHKDFILCLGYKADVIKNYFRHYDECVSNDFVMSSGGRKIDVVEQRYPRLEHHVCRHWDLGACIGRAPARREALSGGRRVFPGQLYRRARGPRSPPVYRRRPPQNKIASFLCVRPTQTFHVVTADDDGSRQERLRRLRGGHLDQRWVFRVPPRKFSTISRKARI